jgi:hypothetical protein
LSEEAAIVVHIVEVEAVEEQAVRRRERRVKRDGRVVYFRDRLGEYKTGAGAAEPLRK